MPMAYEGPLPYIFVSYSHRDKEFVHSVIRHLQGAGCRVWFDGGIEAGSEWPEYIATHLQGCHCVLSFISGAFVESDNCKRELNFAQDLKKPMLNVYIEEVDLTPGMRMQLGLNQALYRSNAKNDKAFMDALARARILEDCKETSAGKQDVRHTAQDTSSSGSHRDSVELVDKEASGADKPISGKAPAAAPEKKPDPTEGKIFAETAQTPPLSVGIKLIRWLMILLELSYCAVFPFVLRIPVLRDLGIFSLILLMAAPHIVIAVINLLLFRTLQKKTTYSQRENYVMGLFLLNPVTSVAAAFFGRPFVYFSIGNFLKFLVSVGLNILPAVIVFLIYATMVGGDHAAKAKK